LRLAGRGGLTDVDAQLDGLTPEQFDELVAFDQLEPEPLGRLIEIVKLGFTALARAWGMDIRPDDLDPVAKAEAAAAPGQDVTPEQGAQLLTGYLGPPRK